MYKTKNILCCDDDLGILEILKIIIEDKGFNVITLFDGTKIMDVIEKTCPSAIFLDLWMPKVNGDILGAKLKSNKKYSGIPLILVSAHRDLEDKAKEINADFYIQKPFDIEEVEFILDSLTSSQ